MIVWHRENTDALRERIAQWRSREAACSNVFREPEASWEISESDGVMLFRVPEHSHFRLYFFAENFRALSRALAMLDDAEYVVNMPSRGTVPEAFSAAFEAAGFVKIARYRRMFFSRRILEKYGNDAHETPPEFAQSADAEKLYAVLSKTFSVYTDYVPAEAEWRRIVAGMRVLIRRDAAGEVRASAVFSRIGKKIVLNFWFAQFGGVQVLRDLLRLAESECAAQLQFWVRADNDRAIAIYLAHGAQFDNTEDVSWLKK